MLTILLASCEAVKCTLKLPTNTANRQTWGWPALYHKLTPTTRHRRRKEIVLGLGALLRPKERVFWKGGSEPPPHQLGLGSAVSSPSGFGAEPWPQMHFGRTNSSENVSSGRKCHLVPVSQFYSVFWCSANLILLGPPVPPGRAYATRTVFVPQTLLVPLCYGCISKSWRIMISLFADMIMNTMLK